MTVYNPGLEADLNSILTILGTTKTSLWPFWEKTGVLVSGIGLGDLTPSETGGAAEALEDDFAPLLLPGGLYSYHFHPTGDHHLAGINDDSYSFGSGADDDPFSVGCWIRPNAIASNTLLAVYDSAGNKEEWRFWIDANGKLALELHDASTSKTETATSDNALTINQWQWVAAAYDGTLATPQVFLYVNGVAVNDGTTVEVAGYAGMENTAAPLTVGCSGVTATPVNEFHGRMALPFICGKELSAAEAVQLRDIMRPMVGIS